MKKEAVPIWEPDVSLQAVPWGSTVQSPEESAPGDPVTHRLKCDFTDGSEMAISELKSWPGENLNIHENYHRVHAKLPSPRLKSNREYMGSRSVAEGRTGRKGRGGVSEQGPGTLQKRSTPCWMISGPVAQVHSHGLQHASVSLSLA